MLFGGKPYWANSFFPAPVCKGAKNICFFLSRFITKFTALLQKLQTPSNNITGSSFIDRTKLKQMMPPSRNLLTMPLNVFQYTYRHSYFQPFHNYAFL